MQTQTIEESRHRTCNFNSRFDKARFKLRKPLVTKNQSIQVQIKDLKIGHIDLRASVILDTSEDLRLLVKEYLKSFPNEGISTLVNTDDEIECIKVVFDRILTYNLNQEYTIYSGDWDADISKIVSIDTFELINVRSATDEVYDIDYYLFMNHFSNTKDNKLAIQLLQKINAVLGESDLVQVFNEMEENEPSIPKIKKPRIKDCNFLKEVEKSDFNIDLKESIYEFIKTKSKIDYNQYYLGNTEYPICASELFIIDSAEIIKSVAQHLGEIAGNNETYALWEGKVKTAYGEREVTYDSVKPLMNLIIEIGKTIRNE